MFHAKVHIVEVGDANKSLVGKLCGVLQLPSDVKRHVNSRRANLQGWNNVALERVANHKQA